MEPTQNIFPTNNKTTISYKFNLIYKLCHSPDRARIKNREN